MIDFFFFFVHIDNDMKLNCENKIIKSEKERKRILFKYSIM